MNGEIAEGIQQKPMQEADRKVLWSLVVVLITIATELAGFLLFHAIQNYSAYAESKQVAENWALEAVTSSAFWTAVFTGLLTVFNIFLWLTTQRSVRLSERAFSDLERPYIYIFGVTNLNGSRTETNITDYPGVSYVVANFGKTPALIRGVQIGLIETQHAPAIPISADRDHHLLTSAVIGPDERRRMREYLPEYIEAAPPSDDPFVLVPILRTGERLFLYIIIEYSGPFTTRCKTSACWQWSDGEGVFVQYGNEEYNYVI